MGKILVSACLAGINCRYDGNSKENLEVKKLINQGNAIPVCPEQLGGLPTPRPPAEIVGDRVINIERKDLTQTYLIGAQEALKLAKLACIKKAILKNGSPMCGCGKIYDGTFSKVLIAGDGVFTKLLRKEQIEVRAID